MPAGTKSFEDPSPLDERKRFAALSISGVTDVTSVVIGFAEWRLPGGGSTPVFVVGSDVRGPGLHPWNVIAGNIEALSVPNTVAVDQTYFDRLGIKGVGATAEIRGQKVEVVAVTKGIRSFTTTPYVFTSLDRARSYTGTSAAKATFLLVHLAPNADVDDIRTRLRASLTDVEVLTQAEFHDRSREFWLFDTGAGAALFAGALLGIIVGTVIVAQTLYSSTKDHINEFATLRAIGSSGRYIHTVIIWQALINAVIGFALAAAIGLVIVRMTAELALPILMTPGLTIGLFALTVLMCVDLGYFRHREGDAYRSRHGVHTMSVHTMTAEVIPVHQGAAAAVLEATGVVKVLGAGAGQVRALKGVSLSLAPGELTLLMGPSGSGKTTLLSVLGCMMTPTEGSVRVCGQSTKDAGPEQLAMLRRNHIGFIFQSYHLFPTLTALDNVRLALDVRGEHGSSATERARNALTTVGLGHKIKSFPSELSGGEQQRVAIARAIVGNASDHPRR